MSRVRTAYRLLLLSGAIATTTHAALPELIVFGAVGRAPGTQIYTVAPDGQTVTQVTQGVLGVSRWPDWSPDGSRIVYSGAVAGVDGIYVISRDGAEVDRISANGSDSQTAWSPDGSQILFRRGVGRFDSRMHVMSTDGQDSVSLTDGPAGEDSPAWHPSGRSVVFRDIVGETLGTLDVSEGTRRVIRVDGREPAWSPDGRRTAAVVRRDIHTMDGDGGGLSRLTIHPARDSAPAWSPDGGSLVFASQRDDTQQLYRIDADGGNVRRLVSSPSSDFEPAWWGPGKLAVTARERQSTMWGWLRRHTP